MFNRAVKLVVLVSIVFSQTIFAENNSDFILFSGNASESLAKSIAKELDINIGKAKIGKFNNGEISIKVEENVRNKRVYVVQSLCKSGINSVNDNLMELYLLSRTLKRASAEDITLIIPHYGYARQDRQTTPRVPISAADVAKLLESSGINRVVTIDLHAGQIQGFFQDIPVDNLAGGIITSSYFADKNLVNPVVVSPDAGGVQRARKFQKYLANKGMESDFAIIIKERAKAGVVKSANLIGDVRGRDVIIVDDMCDTGGTLAKAAEELKKFGAKKIYASITHPVFSKNAIDTLENSVFEEVVVTDTIPLKAGEYKRIKQLSVAKLLSKVIAAINLGDSVSSI